MIIKYLEIKKIKNTVFILFLFVVILQAFSQKSVMFPKTYSFKEAVQMQQIVPKPMVVFLHTNWCKFCFAMKKNTFTDEKVINVLNNKFYFIMLNAEHKKDITFCNKTYQYKSSSGVHKLAEILGTKNGRISYPTTVLISPTFTVDVQFDTFLTKEQFLKILKKKGSMLNIMGN